MISPKKLIRMARKWQKMAALGRKRISLQRLHKSADKDSCSTSLVAGKGHFVVYSSNRRRFVIPLACDSVFFDYLISLIKSGVSKELERALILSIAPSSCSFPSYFHQELRNEHLLLFAC